MGLLGNLKKGVSDAIRKTVDERVDEARAKAGGFVVGRAALGAIDAARGVQDAPAYRLPAENRKTVYTYDGTPLKGLRVGERFVMTAIPGRVDMKSRYTGTPASTRDRRNVAYAYGGKAFGMCAAHAPAIYKLMDNGYTVEVEAYVDGYDGKLGYPKVVGLFGYVDDELYYSLR